MDGIAILSEKLSAEWDYIKAWFDACTKNPKSLHYARYCKKQRIRKKHINRLTQDTNKMFKNERCK